MRMAGVTWKTLVLVIMYVAPILCQANGNASHPPKTSPEKSPGAVTNFVKMLMDIPLGLVEAFKDGAATVESLVVAFMRGLL